MDPDRAPRFEGIKKIRNTRKRFSLPRALTVSSVAAISALLLIVATAQAKGNRHGHWHPRPTTAPWQWQLQGTIDTSVPGIRV